MLVVLIRHGKASERDGGTWPDDRLRPLTEAGTRELERIGGALRGFELPFERLYTSPLTRAVQTARTLAEWGGLPDPELVEALGDGFSIAAVEALLEGVGDKETVGLVGHQPDLGALATHWLGAASGAIEVKKGSLIGIGFDGRAKGREGLLEFLFPAGYLLRLLGGR